jgi:hypothetical protein
MMRSGMPSSPTSSLVIFKHREIKFRWALLMTTVRAFGVSMRPFLADLDFVKVLRVVHFVSMTPFRHGPRPTPEPAKSVVHNDNAAPFPGFLDRGTISRDVFPDVFPDAFPDVLIEEFIDVFPDVFIDVFIDTARARGPRQ